MNSSSNRKRHYSDFSPSDSSDDDDDDFLEVVNQKRRLRTEQSDSTGGGDDGGGNGGRTHAEQEYRREEEFDDGYDDDLKGDDADRAYLDGLPEMAREEILFERYQKRKDLQLQMERFKRAGKLIPRGQSMPVSREAKRQPTVSRSKKGKQAAKKRVRRYSDDGEEEEEEEDQLEFDEEDEENMYESDDDYVEYEERRRKSSRDRDETGRHGRYSRKKDGEEYSDEDDGYERKRVKEREATFEEMKKIILTRTQLEKWLNEPFFDTLLKGCYVRYLLAKREGDKQTYRLCKIEAVEDTSKSYRLPSHKKNIMTNKVLKLRFARSCYSNFKMDKVSNQHAKTTEYNHWVKTMRENNMGLVSAREVSEKLKEIEKCENDYIYDADALRTKMEYKRKHLIDMNRPMLHKEKISLDNEKISLKNELTMGDLFEEDRLAKEAEYKKVKEKLRKVKRLLNPNGRDSQQQQQSIVMSINEQARRRNREQALLFAQQTAEETKKRGKSVAFDPFSRRSTQSKFFGFSQMGSPSPKGSNSADLIQVAPNSLDDVSPSIMMSPRGTTLAGIYENFDVDLSVNGEDGRHTLAPHRPKYPPLFKHVSREAVNSGKTLTLAEYKQRRM